jgi:hypothetical protein
MHYGLLDLLQHSLHQLARHRRKRIQKLCQRLTRFDVFKKNPNVHARVRKYQRASWSVGIDFEENLYQSHADKTRWLVNLQICIF